MSTDPLRTARAELKNWGRWSRDHDDGLGYAAPKVFRQYRPSKIWDDPEPPAGPIDALAAERTERLVMSLGRLSKVCLVGWYVRGDSASKIAADLATSRATITKLVAGAEREYWSARRRRD